MNSFIWLISFSHLFYDGHLIIPLIVGEDGRLRNLPMVILSGRASYFQLVNYSYSMHVNALFSCLECPQLSRSHWKTSNLRL